PPDPRGAVLWAVPCDAERGSGPVPRGAWATTGGGPGVVGLADGVCAAWGGPSRAVSDLWSAPGVHGRYPTGRSTSQPGLRGVRRMRSAPLGSPARGVVCLVAARGRGQWSVSSVPGQSRRPARPLLRHEWGWQSLSPTVWRGAGSEGGG